VIKDVLALYNLIMAQNKNTTIFFYGHSLGTAIVTHAARKISENNRIKNSSFFFVYKSSFNIFDIFKS
jgi:hypothetical protein